MELLNCKNIAQMIKNKYFILYYHIYKQLIHIILYFCCKKLTY